MFESQGLFLENISEETRSTSKNLIEILAKLRLNSTFLGDGSGRIILMDPTSFSRIRNAYILGIAGKNFNSDNENPEIKLMSEKAHKLGLSDRNKNIKDFL